MLPTAFENFVNWLGADKAEMTFYVGLCTRGFSQAAQTTGGAPRFIFTITNWLGNASVVIPSIKRLPEFQR